ncbi:MAG: YihY/virulence factor BrkB family protein [Thiobacillaceae bacterium]|nr:YihY/virulence factor BrkB family protein [Thiobacillaceae bacterium]MCX7674005.1 YihY/virulence factor BrkB family protein [Thiobacillaceae bacterium]MDW8324106.1 YhjD/YihY/BrkB family envelope integrity protein [Burkholderiales bacterium]
MQLRNRLDWLLQVVYTTARLYARNGLANHAAATSFYFLLSATPLLLLLTYAAQWLTTLAEGSIPAAILLAALYEQYHLDRLAAMGFIPSQALLGAGGIGLVTLLLFSRKLVHAIEQAFNVIFPEEGKRRLIVSWALPFVVLPIAFALVVLAVVVQGAIQFLVQAELLGATRGLLLKLLNLLLLFGTVWLLVAIAYWRLPLRHPRLRQAAALALLTTLALYLLFALFEYFFRIEQYRSVYGALGGVVLTLVAAYAAFLAFYLGAQCLYALSKVDVAALERLMLASGEGAGRLERLVFGRARRLLDKYGRVHPPGATLIREGERGEEAYFLYSGRVGLYKQANGQQVRLGELGEGQLFGEMAYLLGEARTATVVAETEVVVLVLPPALLEELMRHSAPLARQIITTLAERLMRMNAVLRA